MKHEVIQAEEKPKIASPKNELDQLKESRKTPLIRESTGFDVTNVVKSGCSLYENALFQLDTLNKKQSITLDNENIETACKDRPKSDSENFDANFDTELVELNNQIEKLLNKNNDSQSKQSKEEPLGSKSDCAVTMVVNREVRTKSESGEQVSAKTTTIDDSSVRRMTISAISFGDTPGVLVTNIGKQQDWVMQKLKLIN